MEEAVNDQSTEEVKQDQVESTEIQPPKEETQLFEVNGEQVSQDELIKRNLQRILNSNPDIRKFEGAIRKLGENSSEAWEDIIAKNNFKERGKIAKGGDVMGQPIPKTTKREKSVMSMTDKEYAEWKKRNNVTGSKF